MTDLFVEVFPLVPETLPVLLAYRLEVIEGLSAPVVDQMGGRIAARLRRTLNGSWYWLGGRIVTDDTTHNAIEVLITTDALKVEQPERFQGLNGIDIQPETDIAPQVQADFVLRTSIRMLDVDCQSALARYNERSRMARVERETRWRGWVVADEPAVSVSIASRMIYQQTVQDYVTGEPDAGAVGEKLVDLWATDADSTVRGEMIDVPGLVRDHRARLLAEPAPFLTPEAINEAGELEWVVRVQTPRGIFDVPAGSLWPIVRLPHLARFEVEPSWAIRTLQMEPKVRAAQVRAVSDVVKDVGVIANAYNSRTQPDVFFSADFEMNLRFNENRIRPYNAETLPMDFLKCGAYRLREPFEQTPVRVCVVNTLSMRLEDFVEAMRRQLDRHFPFTIDVVRERQVRVVARKNLESAVRVVEKESPDVILAFFADEAGADDDEDTDTDATAAYMRSLTLGRGIPTHVIRQSTLDDPDAMPAIIMSILGKTGSSPFVLTEPLEEADFVVGLDVVRQYIKTTGETRMTAIARVYRSDGEFMQYAVRDFSQTGDQIPYVLMRDLFPQRQFTGKRIILHYPGEFPADLLAAIRGWGMAIKATFYPVEIIRTGAPRIYATGKGGISQPPWGSAFRMSDTEALLVSSLPTENVTPQPLHIRTVSAGSSPLPIGAVLRSVLVWSLLAYGAERLPKLPVTVLNAEQLREWLGRGGQLLPGEGRVPFWL